MTEPPEYVIEAARLAAMQSPCAKSKRGVVLFNPERHDEGVRAHGYGQVTNNELLAFQASRVMVASAYNGPPAPYECKNTMVCRGHCADVCLHAEQRAILSAVGCDDVGDLELVHVKVVEGRIVAGGGPSCLQCSKLVQEVRLRGVWLFEERYPGYGTIAPFNDGTPPQWRFYSARAFHEATLANHGVSSLGEDV